MSDLEFSFSLNKTVLIADADATSREVLIKRLARVGIRAIGASNLVELYDHLDAADLLITEWALEEFEGATLFRRIEDDLRPVLLFTSRPMDATAYGACKANGIRAAISKPDRACLIQKALDLLVTDPQYSKPKEPAVAGGRSC